MICSYFNQSFINRAFYRPYGMTMAEIEGGDDLSEEFPGLFGSQPAFLHQVVKQLSTRHMLQHQIPKGIKLKQGIVFCFQMQSFISVSDRNTANNAAFSYFQSAVTMRTQGYSQVFVIFIDIIELQNMRVLYQFKNSYLSLHLHRRREGEIWRKVRREKRRLQMMEMEMSDGRER